WSNASVTHHIDEDGLFRKAFSIFPKDLLESFPNFIGRLPFQLRGKSKYKKSTYSYRCPSCGQTQWQKNNHSVVLCYGSDTQLHQPILFNHHGDVMGNEQRNISLRNN
ncbi:hypothetical protein OAL32_03415, partial [Synechococcus sp. AH-551-G15]|nr:hypothetical protein [Synechococcus sp. AH-551-G15]